MVWLLRLVLLFFILFIIYLAIRFLFRPNRKIESARRHKQFLLLDNEEVVKNFQLTYNGAMFTGEKYLGTTKKAIDVVSISLWPQDSTSLKGMAREDFYFIEKKILEKYPDAEISWKSPIQEFLQQKK
jgi:cbb3-type cytochrome oxidase subunit 3